MIHAVTSKRCYCSNLDHHCPRHHTVPDGDDMGYASGSSSGEPGAAAAAAAAAALELHRIHSSSSINVTNRRAGIRYLPEIGRSVIGVRISRLCRQVSVH